MQFTSLESAANAVRAFQDTFKGAVNRDGQPVQRVLYTIELKKALVQFQIETGTNIKYLASSCNITPTMLHGWVRQYNEGLYSGAAAVSVSRKAAVAHCNALEAVEAEKAALLVQIQQLDDKIALIKNLEQQGFSITKKVA